MSVLSLAEVKTYLRLTSSADDVELQATIDSAEATIAGRVGPLTSVSVTERIPTDGCSLLLSNGPVGAVTGVEGVYPLETVDPDDLYVDDESLIVTYADGYTEFLGRVYDVTYTVGYDTLPGDLVQGVKELVRERWKPQRGGSTRPGSAVDGAEEEFVDGLPKCVYELIEDYILDDELGFA